MSIATGNNTAIPAPAEGQAASPAASRHAAPLPPDAQADAVERALRTAISDADKIGDLLEALRSARLWLPLPDDGTPVTSGTAVTLPTVTHLGSEFVPAYTSADLLGRLAGPGKEPGATPHLVVRAVDLARLLPAGIGIALNAGASQSVPVDPPGVRFLAADHHASDRSRVSVGPLPDRPDELLARIGAGLAEIPQTAAAAAAWLSVQFSGEGMIISVTLDDPGDASVKDAVVAVLKQAADAVPDDASYPIDVTFPGENEADFIDRWIAAFAEPFYQRG